MKKKIILTLAMTAIMTQTAFAADATSSASGTTTPAKTTTSTSSKSTSTSSSKTTTTKTTTPVTTKTTVTAKAGDTKYTIVWGDTLNNIAAKYKTTAKAIGDYNGIKDINKIYAGQVIVIPGTTTATTPTVTTPVTKPVVTTPVTPAVPVVTRQVGINGNYVTTDAINNWDYYVDIQWKDGKMTSVDWDGKSEQVTTMTKDDYAKAGLYNMKAASKLGKEWHEQAEIVEAALLKHGTTSVFKLAEDGKHLASINGVDTTASVSIKVDEFLKYADEAIAKQNGKLPKTATADAMATPSLTTDAKTLVKSLGKDGNWLTAAIGDVVVNEKIVVEGEFHSKNDPAAAVYRKLTPSNHVYGADGTTRDKTKEEFFVLTAKQGMEVKSPNLNLVNGTFVGDITVSAKGFTTSNMTILGNVTFTSQEARDTATFKNTNITGKVTPAVTGALKDGTYVGATEIKADTKYQDHVTVVVKWGKVAYVTYDPKVVVDGVATKDGKKALDAKGEYKMTSTTNVGSWSTQAAVLENAAVASNGAKTADTVTGATISNAGFNAALELAMAQAK